MTDTKTYESPFHAIYKDDWEGAAKALCLLADDKILLEAKLRKMTADLRLQEVMHINVSKQRDRLSKTVDLLFSCKTTLSEIPPGQGDDYMVFNVSPDVIKKLRALKGSKQ